MAPDFLHDKHRHVGSSSNEVTQDDDPKSLYDIGESVPLGHVPARMHAWVIRKEREGAPDVAMQHEIIPIPQIRSDEVLVLVMAAGINYNGVWASLGEPASVFDVHCHDYHIAGSDCAGIVWKVGESVLGWKVGDEVVIHCNQDDGFDEECNGGDPMLSPSQRIWGYETPHGSFAQFTIVQGRQLLRRPQHLSWAESASYMLTLATAYRMLFGHAPNVLGPGSNVLIWGAAGGLGTMALQLARICGANAVGVISNHDKRDLVMSLGAKGVVNRADYDCWGALECAIPSDDYTNYITEVRKFGSAVRQALRGSDPDIVFEHPGETTFPVSCYIVKRGGMVVFCAGTSGYRITMDARIVWMRQKRIQGSHFATLKQASIVNKLVSEQRIQPIVSEAVSWSDIPGAHMKMLKNEHLPGNMAALVQAKA